MNKVTQVKPDRRKIALESVGDPNRPDETVSKEPYVSAKFAELEAERLWPKVWQIACRAEEIPNVGDYVEYTIVHDSIIVVRTGPDKIKAYFNVCQHRARQLIHGSGNTSNFACKNHGWRWNLDGECTRLVDEEDWSCLRKKDVPLEGVKVGTWGGWVFINMDPDAEPLLDYLNPVTEYLDPYELEKMRFVFYKTTRVACNWKTMLDAFVEQYHTIVVHAESLPFADYRAVSQPFGKHNNFRYPPDATPIGIPAVDLGLKANPDPRKAIYELMMLIQERLKTMWGPRMFAEAEFLKTLPDDLSHNEVYAALVERVQKLAAEDGAGGAEVTFEEMGKAGISWHVFPNHQINATNDGASCLRVRPDGDNPNSMLVDQWGLAHFSPGKEPKVEREFFERWENSTLPEMLKLDYSNVEEVHAGMRSRGRTRLRINPVQEASISNYHKTLRGYLFDE